MRVPAFPQLSVGQLLTRPAGQGAFECWYGKEATGFSHARGALWQGIKRLNLGKADTVLVPSYHCGVEIEAVLQAGVRTEFYRVKDDMTVDLRVLKEKIRADCKAVLVIHYYGFAQPIEEIRQLCRRHNLFLLEDCAHALFSRYGGQPLGTYGDLAVFSPTKSLALPDGGLLLINNPATATVIRTKRPRDAVVWKRALGLLARSLEDKWDNKMLRAGVGASRSVGRSWVPIDPGGSYHRGMSFHVSMGDLGMSNISRRLLNGTSIESVIGKRREHYQRILEGIRDSDSWKVCFPSLPEGITPLFFPIRVAGDSRRDLQRVLEGLGIGTFVFGEQLHPRLRQEEYPEARALAREVLCLPVHQALSKREVASILEAMNSLARNQRKIRGLTHNERSAVLSEATAIALGPRSTIFTGAKEISETSRQPAALSPDMLAESY